jgi:ABC-type dipeptide/oligopeptide/nickel transport system permease component
LSGRSYLLSSDIKTDDWDEITLTLTDNNGASSSITFTVEEQESQVDSSLRTITIWTVLFLVLILSTIVFIRKKVISPQESDFVRWSDKKSFDD